MPNEIPFIAEQPEALYTLELANDQNINIDVVNMGNPHAVTIVPDVLTADVAGIGPQVESHKRFPERVNAGFMQVIDENMFAYVYLSVVLVKHLHVVQVLVLLR